MLLKKCVFFALSFLCLALALPALGQKAKESFYELDLHFKR